MGWQRLGACYRRVSEGGRDLWYPPPNERGDQKGRVAAAKRVCAGCLVRADCLAYAEDNNMYVGIWGGLTREERVDRRRALRKRLRRAS